MARIPTAYSDLSRPQSLVSGRKIATYDTTAIGRGMQQFAAGVDNLGDAIVSKQNEAKQQQNAVDIARAEATKTEGLLGIQNQFENDPDYSTFNKRGNVEVDKAITKSAELIRDPQMREKYIATQQEQAVRAKDWLTDKSTDKRRSAETVAFDDALEKSRRLYVDPATPDDVRTKARADIEGAIKVGESTGLLTPEMAANRRLDYMEKADLNRGRLAIKQNPDAVSKPLPATVAERSSRAMEYYMSRGWTKEQAAGIVGNLLHESGGKLDPGARNPGDGADGSDSIGIAQWNSDRARRLKEFAALNKASPNDYGIQLAFVDHELRSNEKAAGEKLKGAKTIQEANDAFITYERPQGSDKGARNAHGYDSRLKYAAQAAGEDVNPDWYKRLPPEQQQDIQDEAETERRRYAVQDKADIDIAATNAPAAIQSTGAYTGTMPGPDKFMSAYGPQEGARRYQEFQASVDTSRQAYDMKTMSGSEIQQMVEEAKPKSSGDNAGLETARYDVLSKAAASTLAAREKDPVSYVQNTFPNVSDAWKTASETGDYQTAIASTFAAQQQLGIRNQKALPNDIAAMTVQNFNKPDISEMDRANAVAGLIFSTKDSTQQQAIFNQLVEAGLPEVTEGAFEAYARGDDGAARRLMAAATVDVGKLPGKAPNTSEQISQQIQTSIMDEGKIGDIYYGLSDGTAENQERAIRDSRLLTNAVTIRVRNGEALEDAVNAAAKDLYGDVEAISVPHARILLPKGTDSSLAIDGLAGIMPTVRTELEKTIDAASKARLTKDSISTGDKAIIDATTKNHVDDIMSQGYFVNSGNGYVFIDPFQGAAISDEKGKPIIYQPSQVPQAVRDEVGPENEAMKESLKAKPQLTQEEDDIANYGEEGAKILKQMREEEAGDQ